MNSIYYVGMDIHKENYTLCCYSFEKDELEYKQTISPDYKMILKYLEQIRRRYTEEIEFVCGYEAGCLGYTLYHQLMDHGVKCVILAPTTMGITNTGRIKTDKRDAGNIARCLAFHTYSEVFVPTAEDEAVKDFIRMRDDQKKALKVIKQQILAFVLRHGYRFDGGKNYWTGKHVTWLKSLNLDSALQESLEEYLITYEYLTDKIKRFDKAERFAAFLGLVRGEDSSGGKHNRGSITKAGNSHIRRLLVEAAQSYSRGTVGHKSVDLKRRQSGNTPQIIAYADKANERLRRKFYRMTLKNGTKRNVAVTAVARELACFMWGLMTNNAA